MRRPSIQARCRCHPTLPPGKARTMRVNHDYDRRGALAYLAAIDRLAKRFPNAVMVHTPRHASWLNQIEIYFSVVQRKAVAPNDFTHLDQLRQRLADFQPRSNATARPLGWRVTSADLDDLLARIDQYQQQTAPPTTPKAA